jgi:hypothetical protein
MKRTAKWHKHLTLGQLRHLRWANAFSLKRFATLRGEQRKLEADRAEMGLLAPVCWDCTEIERRLKAAGINLETNHGETK